VVRRERLEEAQVDDWRRAARTIKRFERNGLYLLAALVTTKAFGSERPEFIQSAGMLERLSQSKNLLSPSKMSIQICRLPFV